MIMIEIWVYEGLAAALRNQGKWQQAAEAYEHALADLRPRVGDLQLREIIAQYALVLRRLGDGEKAAALQRQYMSSLQAAASVPAHMPDALIQRSAMHARAGKFKEALADSTRAIELDPTLHWAWYYRGCLLAYQGDEPAYRAHCALMLERFAGSGPPARDGERTAKTCLLLPEPPDGARITAILDAYLKADVAELLAWDQLAKAMAEYRAGRFEESARWAADAASGLRTQDQTGKAAADLFAAMAHHRLGRHEQARGMLDDVSRWAEQELPKAGVDDIGRHSIENWLILHVALREAKALVRGEPPDGAGQNEPAE
jgi:tetratricopeptide (TPR) repeat protein